MEIKQFSFLEKYEELQDLFFEHWEEIASNKHNRNLNLDRGFFEVLEKNNLLLSIGLFNGDKIVGYSINILVKDTHDCTKLMCDNDALFIKKENRRGFGIKLLKETERQAKILGCYCVLWHAKPNSKLDKLLEKMKYTVKDFLYLKEV